jgi:AcrR family transcriptional regulator
MSLVGNREELLDGALACLYEKGYAHTTARDIASRAGVSLAAIGYHFGTTEALLSDALLQAVRQWGDELERALVDDGDRRLTPIRRRAAMWKRVIDSVHANPALWRVQFELLVAIHRRPELGSQILAAQTSARDGLALLFEGIDASEQPRLAARVGAYYQAMLTGVVAQHLADPDHALSPEELSDHAPPTTTP